VLQCVAVRAKRALQCVASKDIDFNMCLCVRMFVLINTINQWNEGKETHPNKQSQIHSNNKHGMFEEEQGKILLQAAKDRNLSNLHHRSTNFMRHQVMRQT